MDTSVLAPTPSPWYSIGSLGANSLFLGPNYPMIVKGDPAAVDTTTSRKQSLGHRTVFTLVPVQSQTGTNVSIGPGSCG